MLSTKTSPPSITLNPSSISNVVVLPAPFGPNKPNISPVLMDKSMLFTAGNVSPDFSGHG